MSRVEGHLLDEPQGEVVLEAPLEQVGSLMVVDTGQEHGVDLHRVEAGGLRPLDAGEDPVEKGRRVISANVSGSTVSSETLIRSRPASRDRWARLSSPIAFVVRGDVRPRPQGGDPGDDVGDVVAGEGFAAGEPDLVDAEAFDADAGEADDLLGAHRGIAGHELHALGGHAVAAAGGCRSR